LNALADVAQLNPFFIAGKLVDTLVGCVAKQVLAGSIEKVLEDAEPKNSRRTEAR